MEAGGGQDDGDAIGAFGDVPAGPERFACRFLPHAAVRDTGFWDTGGAVERSPYNLHTPVASTTSQDYSALLAANLNVFTSPTHSSARRRQGVLNFRSTADIDSPVGSSPLSTQSTVPVTTVLPSPRPAERNIARKPFKVLDAPGMADNFYYSLVDWSKQNVLAVGLDSQIYLWDGTSQKVQVLVDVGPRAALCSLRWTPRGTYLAAGLTSGQVRIWDVTALIVTGESCALQEAHVATYEHREGGGSGGAPAKPGRVGCLAWAGPLLAAGGRDKAVSLYDARARGAVARLPPAHRMEVCGVQWSHDGRYLASGSNDNAVCIWEPAHRERAPRLRLAGHAAAVKALAWSPHQPALLASGGGTGDRHIRVWNTVSGSEVHATDTGSQVANLLWATTCNELVSTHGYSGTAANQICVWRWRHPALSRVATLSGHTRRVLYLAGAPDGETVVTGSGDETLRLWRIFPPPGPAPSILSPDLGARTRIR